MLRYSLVFCATVCVLAQEMELTANIVDSCNTPIKVEADVPLMDQKYAAQAETPRLKLYYETLCMGCIDFYSYHFIEVVKKLYQYIDVHTYPYGNARTMKYNNGTVVVKCQHGPPECYGNKLHACTLDIMPCPMNAMDYNSCMINLGSNDKAADKCGRKMKINGTTVDAIKECAKGQKGHELLIANGEESKKAGFKYVPYVTINEVEWDGKEGNLMSDLCSAFNVPPEPCLI